MLENLKCDRFKHSEFSFDKLFNSSFKFKLSVRANQWEHFPPDGW